MGASTAGSPCPPRWAGAQGGQRLGEGGSLQAVLRVELERVDPLRVEEAGVPVCVSVCVRRWDPGVRGAESVSS